MKKSILYPVLATSLLLTACMADKPGHQNEARVKESTGHTLSDPSATRQAQNLYSNLAALSGKGILVAHQDALAYGMGWKGDEFRTDINDVCGDYPAIFGWDLGHIGDEENIDGVPFEDMKKWAVAAYKRGGVNTYSWHPRHMSIQGSSWDTEPCVPHILPGGKDHETFLDKLDLVAGFFASLVNDQGEMIPVIFRPWHEMNGGWFWWGSKSCTPEEYKQLFRFTVHYLRNEKDLHQIIYVVSSDVFESAEEYMTYYPGDDCVDVMGFDDYKGLNNKSGTHRTIKMLEVLDSLAMAHGKLFTISETGLETIPNPEWFTDVVLSTIKTNESTEKASWVLFWRNGRPDHFYAPYPGHSSAPDFVAFKEDEFTLFLSDIQGIYQ